MNIRELRGKYRGALQPAGKVSEKTGLYMSQCCKPASDYIYRGEGEWFLDTDDGMQGIPIRFCPWCATKLRI